LRGNQGGGAMSFNAAALRLMANKGLTALDIAEIAEAAETGRSSGAERQARYRARKRAGDVTSDVTSDCHPAPNERDNLTPTHDEKTEAKASPKNGTRLPELWEPKPLIGKTAEMVAAWPAGMIERELAKFKDHWLKTPGVRGRSLDWDASYRNWLRTADERITRHGRTNGMGRHQPDDGLSATTRAAVAVFGSAPAR
jgi:hypothetical protein